MVETMIETLKDRHLINFSDRSLEGVSKEIADQREDIDQLDDRVGVAEENIDNLEREVDQQKEGLCKVQEEVAKTENRLDEVEVVVDRTVGKVEEIDHKVCNANPHLIQRPSHQSLLLRA